MLRHIAGVTLGLVAALQQNPAGAQGAEPQQYSPDTFGPRVVEACAMVMVGAAFPVQGGRNWILNGIASEEEVVACDVLAQLKSAVVPRTILAGTELSGWRLAQSGYPEQVELVNGVPHRTVMVTAVGPSQKRKTTGPCYEPLLSVVCEETEDGGKFVIATRKAEAELNRAEFFARRDGAAASSTEQAIDLAVQHIRVAATAAFDVDVVVKTSDGGLQPKRAFLKRVIADQERLVALLEARNAARKPPAP